MQNPSNFFKLLQGKWELNRTIYSYKKHIGIAKGFAKIKKLDESKLLYKEELEVFINNIKTKSHKNYLYVLENEKLSIKFVEDNRLFYELFFKENTASGEHLCIKDLYKAFYSIADENSFTLHYDILGPNKNDTITTKYLRALT